MAPVIPTILTPTDWTAERDLEALETQWGTEGKDHAVALRWAIRTFCGGVVEVVNHALDYFYQRDLTLPAFPSECLSLGEKLDLLELAVYGSTREPQYHARFQESLALCRWAEAERIRVFADYSRSRGKGWLYPVIQAVDLCGRAAFDLEETMECEHHDFVPKWPR